MHHLQSVRSRLSQSVIGGSHKRDGAALHRVKPGVFPNRDFVFRHERREHSRKLRVWHAAFNLFCDFGNGKEATPGKTWTLNRCSHNILFCCQMTRRANMWWETCLHACGYCSTYCLLDKCWLWYQDVVLKFLLWSLLEMLAQRGVNIIQSLDFACVCCSRLTHCSKKVMW